MGQRARTWFFDTAQTADYDRLSKYNIPSEATFRDLLDTVLCKLDVDEDSADTTQVGYVKLAADADVINRTSAASKPPTVVQPHQLTTWRLPDGTEVVYDDTPVVYKGLKHSIVADALDLRACMRVEWVPEELDSKAVPVNADSVLILDSEDNDTPKLVSVEDLLDLISASDDEKVAVASGTTAGYLEDVLVEENANGVRLTTDGNTLEVDLDIKSLSLFTGSLPFRQWDALPPEPPSAMDVWYMAITDPDHVGDAGRTKRIEINNLFNQTDWLALTQTTEFSPDIVTNYIIPTVEDFTDVFYAGAPIAYLCDGDTEYRYGIIETITASSFEIAGDPLVVGTGKLTELYVGKMSRVVLRNIFIPVTAYNSATSDSLLKDKFNMALGEKWNMGPAKLIKIAAWNATDDSTANPLINVRVGDISSLTDYVITSNSNKGIEASTVLNDTRVAFDITKNAIEYSDNIELKLDLNSGTGDAAYLSVALTFVLK